MENKIRHIIAVSLLLLSVNTLASQNSKHDKLIELVNVMDMDSMMDSMYAQMEVMMKNMSKQMKVQESEQKIFNSYYGEMTSVLRTEMSWEKMQPMVIEIYNKTFTEDEISSMLDFYKTPGGQAILAKMPLVMQESMQMSQSFVQKAMPKIQSLAKKLSEQLQASRK